MFFRGVRHIHFVGIGGIGMSGIAEVLLTLAANFRISGSDAKRSGITDRLAQMGAVIYEGHSSDNISGADVVVTSSAIREDNPEVVAARQRQIPVIMRAEMLKELMRLYRYGIAIAGTHGKTTTTSMIAHMMMNTDLDPTVVVGGRVASLGSNAKIGKTGEYIVVEADESDGSLLLLTPTITVLTNIDADHLDYFTGGIEQIKDCFVEFTNRVPFYGTNVLCLDDANVQAILPEISRRIITYGMAAQADVSAWAIEADKNFGSEFTVRAFGKELGRMRLQVPGLHNIYNSLAAVAVGLDLNLSFADISNNLSSFRGAERRFQIKGEANEILVIDDYGHHPTEIKATLAAARSAGRRVVVLFQPHRYTRTRDLMDDFARAFYGADVLFLVDIYPASEDPIDGITSQALVEKIERFGHRQVECLGHLSNAVPRLKEIAKPGDIILTLGAGNVNQAGDEFLKVINQ